MNKRLELQTFLENLIDSRNVYFQPPSGFQISYPCIIYQLTHIKTEYANNFPYTLGTRYTVTIIDKNPDSSIPYTIAGLQKCSFDRFFVVNNLNHWVFNLYF